MTLAAYPFRDFRGGWNTRDGPFELLDNESPDLENVSLRTRGSLEKRGGKTRFDASGFPASDRAEHVRAWYPGSSKFLMASIDGDLYSFTAAGAGTLRINGTDGAHWWMEHMRDSTGADRLWCVNGVDTPREIDSAFTVANWVDATSTNNLANATKFMRVWRNRMVISIGTDQILRFSAIGNPESFVDADFIQIRYGDEDADPLTWSDLLGDNMLIFSENAVYSMYNEPPAPAFRLLGRPGCVDRFQSCVVEGRCYFWARSGLWSTDGIEPPIYEMGPIENFIQDRMNHAQHSKVRVFSGRDRRVYVALCLDTSTENNCLLELVPYLNSGERDGGPWLRHDLPVSSACTFRPGDIEKLVAGASNDDELHTIFDGTDDDGVAIASHWQSSWKAIVEVEKYERLRRINVLMEGKATVQVFKDFEETSAFSSILEAGTASDPLWDGGTWDGGLWNESSGADLLHCRPETRARYHSVRLENNDLVAPMDIFAIELMARGGKEH